MITKTMGLYLFARIIKHCTAVTAACYLMAIQYGNTAQAETLEDSHFQHPGSGFSYSVAGVRQGSADIDRGGSYSTSSLLLRLGIMKPVATGTLIGFGISLDKTRYDFTDPAVFGGQAPWNTILNLNFSMPIITILDRNWSLLFSPSIGAFQETSATTSDALAYGAVFAASYRFSDSSRGGVGLSAYNRLDETKLFPFLSINLQLTDNLRLGNPLRAGPAGPAGIELVYKFEKKWEASIGRAFRSYRFRLDDDGTAPGGTGTQRGQMTFVRLSNYLRPKLRLDIHAGAVFDGELILENSAGVELSNTDYDTAALLSVNLNGRF
jgi:hypothetical protein